MIATSDSYKRILENPLHRKEVRLNISGVDYMEADIISASMPRSGIFSTFDIGNCVSRELDVAIIPKGEIPRQAKIQAYVRLVHGNEASEWIPQGTFFIRTRAKDAATGALSITAFDAMLKADAEWLDASYDLDNWPMPAKDAVSDIAYRIGVTVDQRTSLLDAYPVAYPVDENGDMNMREVLAGIAISNAGNWVITMENKLRLVKAEDLSDDIYLGNKLESFEFGEAFLPVSRVILKVSGDAQYIAGNESGRTIEKACAWASQEMANSILDSLKNVKYVPFNGSNALLDPAAELGDAITIAGEYGMLAEMSRQLDRQYLAEVSAPGADELDDEFPYTPRERREIDRILGKAYSRIAKTAEQIRLEVSNELKGLSSSINVELDSISAQVIGTQNAISLLELELDGITQRVQDAEGNLAELELTASGLSARVGDVEDGFAELEFTLEGLTITDANGITRINGSAIYTKNLYVKAANITGTLVAGELQGDTIQLFDDDGNYAASFTINAASTADYKLDIKAEAIAITTEEPGAYVFLGNADGAYFQLAGTRAYFGAHVRPDSDGGYNLGGSSYRWGDIYATNDVIQTSDKKKKKNISYTLDKFDVFFDGLMPGTYQMIDGKRDHVGLVAQDVEENLEKCSISTEEFAGFVKAEREDGNGYDYGLRYGEFVALLIDQVQKLKTRVNTLEDKHGSKKSA